MFDLNQAIAAWRYNMRAAKTCRSSDVFELESHLRDTVTELSTSGLSEEEAFGVAARRLGGVGGLAQEFGKINPAMIWGDRLFWMVSGCLVYLLASGLGRGITSLGIFTAAVSGFPLGWIWILPVACATLLVTGGVICVRRLLQRETFGVDAYLLRVARRWRGRVLLAVGVLLVGAGAWVLQMCSQLLMARTLPNAALGKISNQTGILGAATFVVMPALLVLLMLWLRPSRRGALAQD